jgi:hypothetical protein
LHMNLSSRFTLMREGRLAAKSVCFTATQGIDQRSWPTAV